MAYKLSFPTEITGKITNGLPWGGDVEKARWSIGDLIGMSGTPLFPEYTDHGIDHVNTVLDTAMSLRNKSGVKAFSAADAGALALAAIFHDIGMHFTAPMFAALLDRDRNSAAVAYIDKQPWASLWDGFLAEASRFDERMLQNITGQHEPVKIDPAARDWNNVFQLKLIGEFIRRHHPRIAHEALMIGLPGVAPDKQPFLAIPEAIRDIAGLVARSHGIPIRAALKHLSQRFHKREYNGVRAVYLMALLRIADILQIQSSRAPEIVMEAKAHASPLSRLEWRVHDCVTNITLEGDDEEAILIDAEPPDVRTYLRVKEWLEGIQAELDQSWAVLGEVYSTSKTLKGVGLTLRRVDSNLFADPTYEPRTDPKYVPERFSFRTAGPKLLATLIKPLYGDKPGVGIRELMSNSLDAVRERLHYEERHPDHKPAAVANLDGDVVISLDEEADGSKWLTVSDKGIGMKLETVRDYFLTAGATFRDSSSWKEQNTDASGNSEVARTGRFGIGALAAFLIGDSLTVTTRHIEDDQGLKFTASLLDEIIQVDRLACPVGTTIRVSADEAYEALSRRPDAWDWYCLDSPKVIRSVNGEELGQRFHCPSTGQDIPIKWTRVAMPGLEDFMWTGRNFNGPSPEIAVNGIIVVDETNRLETWFLGSHRISYPSINVFDYKGLLPISLDRSRLNVPMFDIDGVLARSVRVDFVVRLIVNAPSGFQADWRYVHSSNGCTARDIHSIRMANFRRLFVYKYGGLHRPHDSILRHYQNKLCQGDAIAFSAFKLTGREQRDASSIRDIWNDLNDPNVRRLLHDLNFDRSQPYRILTAFSGSQTFDAPSSSLAFKRTIGDAQIWESGLCPVEDASMELIAEGLDNVLDYVIDFEIPASTNQKTVSTSFYEAWCEIIGADTLIPYDLTERKRKFAHVYEKYPRIVERYEKRRR